MSDEPLVEKQRFTSGPRAVWLLIGLIAIIVALFSVWINLEWSISQHVYSTKAGLDWFGITFYHNYLFVAAALFSLLFINPRVGKSDLWKNFSTITKRIRQYTDEVVEHRPEKEMNVSLWVLWQVFKWASVFSLFVSRHAFPLLDEVMNPITMMVGGLGDWSSILRIFTLPLFPASGEELVHLMPAMEIQFKVFSYVVSAFLVIFAIRMSLRFLANLTTRRTDIWLKNLLALFGAIAFEIILGAPYWLMNVATPYVYSIAWVAFLGIVFGWFYTRKRRELQPKRLGIYKIVAGLLVVLFVIQSASGAYLFFNWNNNYLASEWYPQTQKEIAVTRWSAGLDAIQVNSLLSLPTSNTSTILPLVRQWDQRAAAVTNTKEIGAYNWMALSSSEIVFYHNTEYWVSPTTPAFPSTDWISQHLIYTHASKVLMINTHNGSVISPIDGYGIPSEPPLYYGEGAGFDQNVYVHLLGYDEVQNASYSGMPDYTLSGLQKGMWFTFSEAQLGFAFSSGEIEMLWNRNIFNRVQSVLISGMVQDPAAYLVSDGKNVYFVSQIYIDYPLKSGFAASDYLRFFGVVLVNVSDGSMQGYTVSNLIGTNSSDFITQYYQEYYGGWKEPPAWLIPQLRYPEQLLGTPSVFGQLDYDFVFHVNDPFVFRARSQFYERPESNTVQYIPWVDGEKTYFVGLQLVHYRSAVSKNLAGMYIAYGGDRLGQIYLYQNPSESAPIIGPSAAENALTTNSQVRTQLTLLPNYRFGSYLLYSVGGHLTYFVAVYTNPGASGVVTQLPFMTAVSPSTATVGVGQSAALAYNSLGTGNLTTIVKNDRPALVKQVATIISTAGYTLVNVTSVNPTVWVNAATVSLSGVGLNEVVAQVTSLLNTYGGASVGRTVYEWNDSSGNLNIGVFQLRGQGLIELHYVTIYP